MSADQDLLRRVPPQNIEAEESVLGAILLDNNCIDAILDAMGAGDLYRESHRLIFQAMTALWDRREPIDATTLTTELRGRGVLEQIGGPAYVAELAFRVPTAANAAHYARIVHAMAMYRAIAVTAATIASEAYDGAAADIETFADRAGRDMLAVCEPRGSGGRVHAGQILPGVLETVAAWREQQGVTGLSTGLQDLDRITAGLQPTELIVISRRGPVWGNPRSAPTWRCMPRSRSEKASPSTRSKCRGNKSCCEWRARSRGLISPRSGRATRVRPISTSSRPRRRKSRPRICGLMTPAT